MSSAGLDGRIRPDRGTDVITRMSAEEHFRPDGSLVSDERLQSCGRPTPFSSVQIVDEAGNSLQ